MKIAFIHDHRFVEKNGLFYTTGGLNKEVWSVYLDENITLTVFARHCMNSGNSSSLSSQNNVSFKLSKSYNNPKDFLFKRAIIRKELLSFIKNYDGCIIRLPSFLGLIAVDICKEINKPYAVEVVGNVYDALFSYGSIIAQFLASYVHKLNKKAILDSPYAIYVTKFFLQESYPCKNKSISASDVNISVDPTFSIDKRFKKIENLTFQEIEVGQIGNIEVLYKGYEVCFKALSRISTKYPNMKIIYSIAGSGSNGKILKIAKKYPSIELRLKGKLNKIEVLDFLDNIDIYMHPSFQEGLSRAIIEALSRGCPALTSNIGGTSELIPEKYMHKPGDYIKLSSDIERVINNKEELRSMAQINFNHSKNYLDTILLKKRKKFWSNFYDTIKE